MDLYIRSAASIKPLDGLLSSSADVVTAAPGFGEPFGEPFGDAEREPPREPAADPLVPTPRLSERRGRIPWSCCTMECTTNDCSPRTVSVRSCKCRSVRFRRLGGLEVPPRGNPSNAGWTENVPAEADRTTTAGPPPPEECC